MLAAFPEDVVTAGFDSCETLYEVERCINSPFTEKYIMLRGEEEEEEEEWCEDQTVVDDSALTDE